EARRHTEEARARYEAELIDLGQRRDTLGANVAELEQFEEGYRDRLVRRIESDLALIRDRGPSAPEERPEGVVGELPVARWGGDPGGRLGGDPGGRLGGDIESGPATEAISLGELDLEAASAPAPPSPPAGLPIAMVPSLASSAPPPPPALDTSSDD